MLVLKDIQKTRGTGLQGYSLQVSQLELRQGQRLALVGPSGSGKSTLLDLLALVLSPDPGGIFEFRLENRTVDVAGLWRQGRQDELARLRSRFIGYVLQTGGLLGFLDVQSNIGLPRALLGLPCDDTVRRLAQQLEITDQLHKRPAALSVGQRQRVGIARALAHEPALLLADEPTASLDPPNAERVMNLLVEQAEQRGLCIVVATHDASLAARSGLRVSPLQVQCSETSGTLATLLGEG